MKEKRTHLPGRLNDIICERIGVFAYGIVNGHKIDEIFIDSFINVESVVVRFKLSDIKSASFTVVGLYILFFDNPINLRLTVYSRCTTILRFFWSACNAQRQAKKQCNPSHIAHFFIQNKCVFPQDLYTSKAIPPLGYLVIGP